MEKKVIVVPRRKEFEEHIDDHQMQIAEVLLDKKLIQAVFDINELESLYNEILNGKEFEIYEGNSHILDIVIVFIEKN